MLTCAHKYFAPSVQGPLCEWLQARNTFEFLVFHYVCAAVQGHEQAVDPNLVLLSKAYQEAKEKLGEDALAAMGSGSEDEGMPEGFGTSLGGSGDSAEDLFEGLGRKARIARAEVEAAEQVLDGDADADVANEEPVSSRHSFKDLFRKDNSGKGGKTTVDAPYIPSNTFEGAKVGYAFKKGAEGVGYYTDAISRGSKQLAGQKRGRQDDSDAATLVGDLRKGVSMRPIGGDGATLGTQNSEQTPGGKRRRAREVEPDSDGEEGGAAGSQPNTSSPGGKRQKRKGDDTDSDSDGGRKDKRGGSMGRGRGKGGKQKALPGRIRKKLAMQRGK